MKGEVIDGVLYAMTRPRARHQHILGRITRLVSGPYDHDHTGPGGWWILPEPGIELPRAPEISPDVAGWRRERLPTLPTDGAITVVPDWVCEVLSPRTRRYNLTVKRPFYAEVGVAWMWLVDLEAMVLTVHRNADGAWVDAGTFADDTEARAAPFSDVSIDVRAWWSDGGA